MGFFYNFRGIQHFSGGFVSNHPSGIEHDCPGGVLQHQVHVVGNQHNSNALAVQLTQKIHDFRVMLQILTGCRLVP